MSGSLKRPTPGFSKFASKICNIIKTVLITGAGRGLGRAIANAYRQDGFRVLATDREEDLLSDLEGLEGFVTFQMDVSRENEVRVCAEKARKLYRGIDVVVSNAGVFDFYPVSEAGGNKLKNIFDVNVFGLANLTRYFLPLLYQNRGRLVVISSESFRVPAPFQPYAVSKQALESIYRSVKLELALKGIQSVLIRPGAIRTRILDETIGFSRRPEQSLFENEFMAFLKAVPKYIGKVSTTEEVARVVVKAGTVRHPKEVYHINHNPLVGMLSSLPASLQSMVIKKRLK